MDTCGFPKDSFYYYQSWWTDKPVLHLLPHWNWPGKEGQEIDVRCFSNLEEVELLLNGQSLGRKPMPHNSHLAWLVKYSPGILEARGYKGGKLVATTTRETAGAPAAIALEPDRATLKANGEDVSVITVSVRDTQGRLVPTADNEITFTISGGGHNIGVGNGNPSSHEPDKAGQRRVFNGLAQLIVQATAQAGSIQVTAESPGLKSAVLRLSAQAAPLRPAVPASASSSRTTTTPKS
jgi:beta-galactosidase